MPFRDFLEVFNRPYWKWDTKVLSWDNQDSIYNNTVHRKEDGNVVYYIDVPGFNKDNLSVKKDDNRIYISGEREEPGGIKEVNFSLYMRKSEVNASVKDGILRIEFVSEKKEDPKLIDVKVE
jgi:HSP20 family molecular chaperone IbpA